MSDSVLQEEAKRQDLFVATKEHMPELAEAYYGPVKQAVYRDDALDLKTKRLISLGIAIQAGCKGCILAQTNHSLNLGASVAEIFDVCRVAISMGGTMAWSHVILVADYLQERGLLGGADSPGDSE
jgi:AhpD family alkylhydroperoxidase